MDDRSLSEAAARAETLRSRGHRHGLAVGAATSSRLLGEEPYTSILVSEFGLLEAENEMKFGPIHPTREHYAFDGPDALVHFAEEHGMLVRGHTLVWHNQNAPWIPGRMLPGELCEVLRDHIATVVGRYAGRIVAWDVVNEAFEEDGALRSSAWYDAPGIGLAGKGTATMEQAFRWAREADPNAKLFYNDYDDETVNPKSDAIFAMARDFVDRGVPIDGVGFQAHLDLTFGSEQIASFRQNLDRFARLGLELQITEMDIRVTNDAPETLEAQARLYGEIARICADQPAVTLFQTWGFTDRYSWIPGFFKGTGWALLWDAQLRPKAAYDAVLAAWE